MSDQLLERVLKSRVYEVVSETPLDRAGELSERLGSEVWLKREDTHPGVFSFKIRGAYNRIAALTKQERARGVVAASAGNHAQGVALAASRLGIEALIVMPLTTPEIKVRAVARWGAAIELFGDSYDEAAAQARLRCDERGAVFVHPYDDLDVIAGQGTVALEILRQARELDAIFVPVGGGGLIAGVAAYAKSLYPKLRIIGVEPEDAGSLSAALAAGERVTLDRVGLFADGVAVRQVGELPFEFARRYVDQVVLVSSDEICGAIKDIFEATRSVVEPAGALALAGLKRWSDSSGERDKRWVAVVSGANVNFDRLRYVAERAEIGEAREALLAVAIPERPGSFLEFVRLLSNHSITEFNYRYATAERAHVFVGLALPSGPHALPGVMARLQAAGLEVTNLTGDELAGLHVRFMVGGRAPGDVRNERLYRFEFPERPGALRDFLTYLGGRFNITLFHYRNHGAAYGRVLVGLDVPDEQLNELTAFCAELGYENREETANPAYRLFLS
ncbi:MAG TPA: threonine ammonia-lyase, biosynthetic [Polyangiaceae bacterium]|nr:threonine ammonia-lyase, biosynthetic [Polyangiaceae bacterium]